MTKMHLSVMGCFKSSMLASVAAHCWFNADKSSTTLAQHYSNTWSAVYVDVASILPHYYNAGDPSIPRRMTLSSRVDRKTTTQIH